MSRTPHATHEATGKYRAIPLLNHPQFRWTVVCPDGTEHAHSAIYPAALLEELNAEDRADRTMTDADRLAAIREIIDRRPTRPQTMYAAYLEIEALFDSPQTYPGEK
jgi:hypothetical protein